MSAEKQQPFLLKTRKNIIVVLRLIVFSIIYLIVFQERDLSKISWVLWLILGVFLLSEIVCLFEHRTSFFIQRILGWIFIFDTILISLLVYFLASKSTSLFTAYFAVIALAAMAKNVGMAFVITIIVSVFYLLLPMHQGNFVFTEFITRPLFFFGIALFSGYLSEETNAQYKEKKRTEEQLKESEQLFKVIFDNATDGILLTSIETKRIYIGNRMICQMLDYSPEELRQLGLEDIHPKENLPYIIKEFDKQAKREVTLANDIPVKRKDGTVFYADISSSPITLGDKSFLIGILRDITERKRAEDQLQYVAQEWKTTFDSITDLVSIHDKNHRIFKTNKCFADTFKMEPQKLIGRTCHQLIHDTKDPLPNCPHQQTIETKKPAREEFFEPCLGIYLEVSTSPILNKQNEMIGSVHIIKNITERKRLEKERDTIQTQLFHSQKMEAIGSLAGGVAHDFNNLLTVIKGHAELARNRVKANDELADDLETVSDAAHHAGELTRQLLLFARKQPMSFSPVNLNKTVLNLNKMLKRLLGETIETKTNLADDIWTIRADKVNIEQVMMNMAVNARDAMSQGGTITVKTEKVTIDQEYTHTHPETRVGQFVRLSITDTGSGMDKETLQRIFEPFFSTKEPGQGTGLGLAVIYGIIKQHDGWINAYSEPGQGTIFKIYLPAYPNLKAENGFKEIAPVRITKGAGERILLIEDETPVRKFAQQVLAKNGYVVLAATTIKEAEDVFAQEKGDFALVFSDTVLPDGNGLNLVRRFKQHNPQLNILMSSGYTNGKTQAKITAQEKQYAFLQKPYGVNNLLQMVRQVIEDKE